MHSAVGAWFFCLNIYLRSRLVLAFTSRDHIPGLGGITNHILPLVVNGYLNISRELGIQPIEFRDSVAMTVSVP